MENLIRSKAIVFGLPISLFVLDFFLTVFTRDAIVSLAPLMHFAGGFAMALFFLHFWERNFRLAGIKSRLFFTLTAVSAFAILIGVLWEFGEFSYEWLAVGTAYQFPTPPTYEDTLGDLFLDLLGGLAAAIFYFNSKLYKEEPLSK